MLLLGNLTVNDLLLAQLEQLVLVDEVVALIDSGSSRAVRGTSESDPRNHA